MHCEEQNSCGYKVINLRLKSSYISGSTKAVLWKKNTIKVLCILMRSNPSITFIQSDINGGCQFYSKIILRKCQYLVMMYDHQHTQPSPFNSINHRRRYFLKVNLFSFTKSVLFANIYRIDLLFKQIQKDFFLIKRFSIKLIAFAFQIIFFKLTFILVSYEI